MYIYMSIYYIYYTISKVFLGSDPKTTFKVARWDQKPTSYKWGETTPISRGFVDPRETHLFSAISRGYCSFTPIYNWFSEAHLVKITTFPPGRRSFSLPRWNSAKFWVFLSHVLSREKWNANETHGNNHQGTKTTNPTWILPKNKRQGIY